jgi:hypothetical protein
MEQEMGMGKFPVFIDGYISKFVSIFRTFIHGLDLMHDKDEWFTGITDQQYHNIMISKKRLAETQGCNFMIEEAGKRLTELCDAEGLKYELEFSLFTSQTAQCDFLIHHGEGHIDDSEKRMMVSIMFTSKNGFIDCIFGVRYMNNCYSIAGFAQDEASKVSENTS